MQTRRRLPLGRRLSGGVGGSAESVKKASEALEQTFQRRRRRRRLYRSASPHRCHHVAVLLSESGSLSQECSKERRNTTRQRFIFRPLWLCLDMGPSLSLSLPRP